MKKRVITLLALVSFIFLFSGLAAAAPQSGTPAVAKVLVLPFQINGGKDIDYLNESLPSLFIQRLADHGLEVLPYSRSLELLKQRNVASLDTATVRRLAAGAMANYAIYGSFNKTQGDAFSLDVRLVDARGTSGSMPFFAERGSLVELLPAVDEVVDAMNGSMVVETAAAPGNGIADIRVRGLKVLDPDVVLMRLTTHKGDPIDPAAINEEIKLIWNLGYFSDVTADIEPSGSGQVLIYTLVEKPRIEDVIVNGSDAVDREDILATMTSKPGSILNDRFLAEDIQKVTELYRKEGYYLVKVDHRIEQKEGSPTARLIFDVEEGNKLYITEIKFEGLETIDEDDLKDELALKEHWMFSWITGDGILREEYLERDSAAITAYGLNNGYINIQVGVPDIQYTEEGIVITFAIKEGKRYALGDISFVGDLIDTNERLLMVIATDNQKENNTWFKLSTVQDDLKAIAAFYSNYGYAFADVNLRTTPHDEDETIDVMFIIQKKQKVYVRRVLTEGNSRTRDNVILRELRLGDGDLYEGYKIRRTNDRLNRLRFFTQAETNMIPTDKEDEVDLKVSVREDRTGVLSAGVGYSTLYEFGVSGTIMQRNLYGKGYSLGLTGFLAGTSQSIDLTFINPRINDTYLGMNNKVYAVWTEWDDFEKKTIGDTITFSYPLGEFTSIWGGYRIDRYTLYNIPDTATHAYKEYEGKNWSSVVSAGISYDSTNSRTHPTRGVIVRLASEYGGGGIGGNDNFIRPTLELQQFIKLWNDNHVFHWRAKTGAAFENSDKTVPVFDRFFIGGMDSIRGYDTEDLAPRDEYDDEYGGDRMGYLNLEYVWQVKPELGLSIVPFFDIGFNIDTKQTDDPFTELKKSVGLELRWRSPMGDMRFAYGWALDKNVKGERPGGRFEFSMGQYF